MHDIINLVELLEEKLVKYVPSDVEDFGIQSITIINSVIVVEYIHYKDHFKVDAVTIDIKDLKL